MVRWYQDKSVGSMKCIEIVGGGLSGLSLGIFLRRLGVGVRIVEAAAYPRHKVCGEFVCGVSPEVMQEMGIAPVFDRALCHRNMSWWIGNDLVMSEGLPQTAYGLSRFFMDRQLAKMFVEAGGELVQGQRMELDDAPGRVWAIGKRKRRGKWIGLKVHVLGVAMDGLEMHVGKRGYLGVCGVEESRANCCGLFQIDKGVDRKNLLASYLELNGMDDLLERFRGWREDKASLCATAGFSMGAQQRPGRFCVGDSNFLIPPFTGNGMSMAIESAWIAGPWLAKYAKGELDWIQASQRYDACCATHFKKRTSLAGGLHPLLLSRFGRHLVKWSAKAGVLPFESLFTHLRT